MKRHIKQLLGATAVLFLAGFQPVKAEIRIVGGIAVSIDDFPSTVALLSTAILANTGSALQAQMCGGTLIQSTWVLTAAHCVVNRDGNTLDAHKLSVLAGSDKLDNPNHEPLSVDRIIIHEAYNNVLNGEDIALIELTHAANAPAIALTESKAASNDYAYIAGWGLLQYVDDPADARFPKKLQAASVRIVTGSDCASIGGVYATVDANKQICAGVVGGGVDTCQGDSGGPIYTMTKQNTLRLGGITSWGDECARANKPGVYTDAFHYRDWVFNTINGIPTGPVQASNTSWPIQTSATNPISGQSDDQYRERLTVSGSAEFAFLSIAFAILGLRRATRSVSLLK